MALAHRRRRRDFRRLSKFRKINTEPISNVTSFVDKGGTVGATYEVRANGLNGPTATGSCEVWETPYKKIHLDRPAGGSVGADGATPHSYTYSPTTSR